MAISKHAHNQLDDGLFGQTLILSAFNYAKGEIYGVEATGNYDARRIFHLRQPRLVGRPR